MHPIRFTRAARFAGASSLALVLTFFAAGCAQRTLPTSPDESLAADALKSKKPPKLKPNKFGARIDNPFFPLIPGTVFEYRGTSEGETEVVHTRVTGRIKRILGVTTTVVLDSAYLNGHLVEATEDWYAQDKQGNVWYFGEDTKEFDEQGNVVSTDGTWQAGVDGAEAGIIMEAKPKVGDVYQQENAPDVAEDQAKVLSLNASVVVPYGRFSGVLQTEESTPLDPDLVEHKFYACNVGFVKAVSVSGPEELLELVRVTRTGEPPHHGKGKFHKPHEKRIPRLIGQRLR